jgi:hypothetical protein
MKIDKKGEVVVTNAESVCALAQMLVDRRSKLRVNELDLELHKGELNRALDFMLTRMPEAYKEIEDSGDLDVVIILAMLGELINDYTTDCPSVLKHLQTMFKLALLMGRRGVQ